MRYQRYWSRNKCVIQSHLIPRSRSGIAVAMPLAFVVALDAINPSPFMSASSRRIEQIGKTGRGERGQPRREGDPGEPAKQPLIIGWKIDAENFRAVPFGADGKPLAALELHTLFRCSGAPQHDQHERCGEEELERLLPRMMLGPGL